MLAFTRKRRQSAGCFSICKSRTLGLHCGVATGKRGLLTSSHSSILSTTAWPRKAPVPEIFGQWECGAGQRRKLAICSDVDVVEITAVVSPWRPFSVTDMDSNNISCRVLNMDGLMNSLLEKSCRPHSPFNSSQGHNEALEPCDFLQPPCLRCR